MIALMERSDRTTVFFGDVIGSVFRMSVGTDCDYEEHSVDVSLDDAEAWLAVMLDRVRKAKAVMP